MTKKYHKIVFALMFMYLFQSCDILKFYNENIGSNNCIKQLIAPPYVAGGIWGQEVQIINCFGNSNEVHSSFTISDKSGDVPIRLQIRVQNGTWAEYKEGDAITGQTVYARAQTASVTSANITISIKSSCPCN